ncbi:MAG: CBS domain-containing protein [bacterium]
MPNLLVRDLMTEKLFTVRPEHDLAHLNDMMAEMHVRHMPVVDEDGALVGLVSQRDLLRTAMDPAGMLPVSEQRELLRNTRVREIMTVEVETATPDTDIAEAGNLMLENKLGCLPVVEGDQLVGILTESDFVKYVVRE